MGNGIAATGCAFVRVTERTTDQEVVRQTIAGAAPCLRHYVEEWFLSQSRSAEFIRVCQPGPAAPLPVRRCRIRRLMKKLGL